MKKYIKSFMLLLMISMAFFLTACEEKVVEPEGPPVQEDPADPVDPQTPDFTKPDPDANFVIEKDGDYVYFGRYFSSIKPEDVSVKETPEDNGFYKGSDGHLYAKVDFNLGQTYINSTKQFSDGTPFSINTDYQLYFKCEKLKWRILKQEDDKALLLCTNIVDNVAFQPFVKRDGKNFVNPDAITDQNFKTYLEEIAAHDDNKTLAQVYANDWEYSYVRYYLNNIFYETAFNDLQKALIIKSNLDNSVETTNDIEGYHENLGSYVFNNTEDNVFLLTWKDMFNSEYGFNEQPQESDPNRRFKNTDYAIAKRSYNYTDGYGDTWLRSRERMNSNDSYIMASYVFNDGKMYGGFSVTTYICGFAPAVWVNLSEAN